MSRYLVRWHRDAGEDFKRLAADPRLAKAVGELYALIKNSVPDDGIDEWDEVSAVPVAGLRKWSKPLLLSELMGIARAEGDQVLVLAAAEIRSGDDHDDDYRRLAECVARRAGI